MLVPGVPPAKVQSQDEGLMVEVSVNWTLSVAINVVLSVTKSASGGSPPVTGMSAT